MKNRCKFNEKLYLFIEDHLDEQQKTKLLEHMENCDSCKEEYEILKSVKSEFGGLEEVKVPEGYHQRLHMKLVRASNETNIEEKKTLMNFMNKFLPVAAVLLLMFVTVKGVSVYNAMTTKNDCLASATGAQMDSLSMNDQVIKNEDLAKLQEKSKEMKISENSVKDKNIIGGMRSSASAFAVEGKSFKASDINASAANMKAVPKNKEISALQDNQVLANEYSKDINAKGLQSKKAADYGFETIIKDANAKIYATQNIIVQSKERFKELWELTFDEANQIPEIDFEKYTVIAVYMGQKSTGGYGIEITNVVENEKNMVVTIKEISPPGVSIVTQALTSPCHIVKIKKTDKEIIFNK